MISKRVFFIAAALLALTASSVMAQVVNVDDFIVNNLLITGNGQLNLGNYGVATTTANSTIYGYVTSGCNGLTWNGLGIMSTEAATDPAGITAIGMMTGVEAQAYAGITDFHGHAIADDDSLLAVTKYGDANLDGIIDGTDYAFIDYGYLNGGTGWVLGDFTYDGLIDGTDYAYIDYVYLNSGAAAASAAAVPEPSAVILLISAICGLGLYLRKR